MTQAEPQELPTESALPAKPTLVKPVPMEMDSKGLYVVRTQNDEFRVAKMLIETGAINASLKSPLQVMVAMQAAKSLGLNPYTALRQMAFINGSLTFFGDLELAVVRMSGQLEWIEEWNFLLNEDGKYVRRSFENSNLHLPAYGAICRVKRKDMPVAEEAFTEADAKTAGLWGRGAVWSKYPARMMQMRARGLILRSVFSDITQGMENAEYGHIAVDRDG